MPRHRLGCRTIDTPPVSNDLTLRYSSRIKAILNRPWNEDPVTGKTIPHVIQLSDEARELWKAFWYVIEEELPEGGELNHIQDWAGKLPGLVARVAGLVHVARYATVNPEAYPVSAQDMQQAISWGYAAQSHALAAFDFMGADQALEDARTVQKWIERHSLKVFTFRDCHRGNQRRFPRADDLLPAIRVLEERHFIRDVPQETQPWRPSKHYVVNPFWKFQ